MRNYADAPYLHARIHAMRSRLLGYDDYAAFARDQAPLLEKSAGREDYLGAKERVFREQISGVLYLAGATRTYFPLFLGFLRQYEARNMKLLLARASGRPCMEQWYDIGQYAVLPRDFLRGRPDIDDLRTTCMGTYLQDVFTGRTTFERMEVQVDVCAAQAMESASELFHPEAVDLYREITLRRVAVTIVVWQWRLREGFGWSDEMINPFLRDLFGHFEEQVVTHVKKVLEESIRRLWRLRKSGSTAAVDVEKVLDGYYLEWISSMFHRDFHSVSCVVAYLWLLHCQIMNLLRIIDGLRFRLPVEEILNGIIREV